MQGQKAYSGDIYEICKKFEILLIFAKNPQQFMNQLWLFVPLTMFSLVVALSPCFVSRPTIPTFHNVENDPHFFRDKANTLNLSRTKTPILIKNAFPTFPFKNLSPNNSIVDLVDICSFDETESEYDQFVADARFITTSPDGEYVLERSPFASPSWVLSTLSDSKLPSSLIINSFETIPFPHSNSIADFVHDEFPFLKVSFTQSPLALRKTSINALDLSKWLPTATSNPLLN